MILILFFSFLDLNQYTVKSTVRRPTTLTSPKIFHHKACFTFQHFVPYTSNYWDSEIFVFARNASNEQLLPFWKNDVYHERGKWHTIKILLNLESGFDKVNRLIFISFWIPNRVG